MMRRVLAWLVALTPMTLGMSSLAPIPTDCSDCHASITPLGGWTPNTPPTWLGGFSHHYGVRRHGKCHQLPTCPRKDACAYDLGIQLIGLFGGGISGVDVTFTSTQKNSGAPHPDGPWTVATNSDGVAKLPGDAWLACGSPDHELVIEFSYGGDIFTREFDYSCVNCTTTGQ